MIALSGVSKHYGRQALLVDASFQLDPGDKVALVGPNGSGKTTLFRLIVGEERPDDGEVSVPKGLAIGYFRQDAGDPSERRVLDEAIAGSGRLGALHEELAELERRLADPAVADLEALLERFGQVQGDYQQLGGYELEARAKEVLAGLGFRDEQVEGSMAALSAGWRMRVSIAKVLIGKPAVLLLDEPTNHLDIVDPVARGVLEGQRGGARRTCSTSPAAARALQRRVRSPERTRGNPLWSHGSGVPWSWTPEGEGGKLSPGRRSTGEAQREHVRGTRARPAHAARVARDGGRHVRR